MSELHPGDPLVLFERAFAAASAREPFEANAMSLATVGADGRPSVRIVLLKGLSPRGFVFFTNYESRKGRELLARPFAAISLHWPKGQEQVRVEGEVERVSDQESDAYFALRPRGSQLGAWASAQSEPGTVQELEQRVQEVEQRFFGVPVPRPSHWGGFCVVPRVIEFWYGRESRLHERHHYERQASGEWSHRPLFP